MQSPTDGGPGNPQRVRADITAIDATARRHCSRYVRRSDGRALRFFKEILTYHACGEENAVCPMVEEVDALVAEAYAFRCLTK